MKSGRVVKATGGGLVLLTMVATTHTATPAQAAETTLECGQVVTSSVRVVNDLTDCAGDGLVVGAHGITIDLNGHTVEGTGLGSGVLDEGFDDVAITNGTIRDFDFGVLISGGAGGGEVSDLSVELSQETAISLSGAGVGNVVHSNTFVENALAIGLYDGTVGAVVRDNVVGVGGGNGLEIVGSDANTVENNAFADASDGGVLLSGASGNVLRGNRVGGVSDAALLVEIESNGNRLEGNVLTASDAGIIIDRSVGNSSSATPSMT
jgi:parallel beta-helix repeat protein